MPRSCASNSRCSRQIRPVSAERIGSTWARGLVLNRSIRIVQSDIQLGLQRKELAMENVGSEGRGSRRRLAEIALQEAASGRAGNKAMAGPEIERYLSVLREALNRNAGTTEFSNTAVGFPWCCAFVYYCCLRAGFRFPAKPVETYRFTLAAGPAWLNWAQSEGTFHSAKSSSAEVGDVVLLNRVYDGNPLDHTGIVVAVQSDHLLCAEGNNGNRCGVFRREYSDVEGYVRLPEIA